MLQHLIAVIGAKDDDGVVAQTEFVEKIERSANFAIDVSDAGVVTSPRPKKAITIHFIRLAIAAKGCAVPVKWKFYKVISTIATLC